MRPTFRWTTFDVTPMLPGDFREEALDAATRAEYAEFARTPVISREASDVARVPRGRVHADQVVRSLPWLTRLYRSDFLGMAEEVFAQPVVAARDRRYGVVLNVQRGREMRFECHVDSNPVTGLLFCSDHDQGAGGELVFARDPG